MAMGAAAVILVLAPSALARTFTVTRADDPTPGPCSPGDCSLREAVAAADAHHGADAIEFANAVSGNAIVLAHGQLTIRRALTISGPGASKLAVSGNGLSRISHLKNLKLGDQPWTTE